MSHYPTLPDHEWVCQQCSFRSMDFLQAYLHGDTTDHWLWERLLGDRMRPATREMHGSDAGGCYVAMLINGQHVHPAGPSEAAWRACLKL